LWFILCIRLSHPIKPLYKINLQKNESKTPKWGFFLVSLFFFLFLLTCSCHHFLFNLYKDEHVQRLLTISPHIVLILSKHPFFIEKEASKSLLPLHQHVHRKTTTFIHHVNKDNPRKGSAAPFFLGKILFINIMKGCIWVFNRITMDRYIHL
jgi:hypothetical protein